MFARTLSTMKSRLFDGDGADDLSDLERLDIERRLCEFEREKREIREEVESLQTQYQKTVVRAGHVDEGALDVVRDDLSRVIEAAAVARAAYQRVLIRHRVLQLLASPIHSGGPLTGLDVDPDRWSTGTTSTPTGGRLASVPRGGWRRGTSTPRHVLSTHRRTATTWPLSREANPGTSTPRSRTWCRPRGVTHRPRHYGRSSSRTLVAITTSLCRNEPTSRSKMRATVDRWGAVRRGVRTNGSRS